MVREGTNFKVYADVTANRIGKRTEFLGHGIGISGRTYAPRITSSGTAQCSFTRSGHTLQTSGTVTGTYQWDAAYSGDSNNNFVTESITPAEQVVVSQGSQLITFGPLANQYLGVAPFAPAATAVNIAGAGLASIAVRVRVK
jgi:hypothetical protein